MKNNAAIDYESQLADHIAQFAYDPLGFVYYAFPWEEEGSLKNETGPDDWQREVLEDIGKNALTATEAIRIAVRSGHGIGKTALISWIIIWFVSTRPHPQIITTANTKEQLTNKTWREVAKWHKMLINKHWFTWTATKFYHVDNPETWFANAVPWSKDRSEAFAGTHEEHVLILFDEASAIEDIIWEVAEGAMTTPGAMWIAFGNPTRSTGRFSECFKRFRHRWINKEIDSRTAKKANAKQIEQWIEDYGEDSDFVRVRVKGQEPRTGSTQLIGSDLVQKATRMDYPRHVYEGYPMVLGVDVARFGDDQSVILARQGLKLHEIKRFRNLDTMQIASHVNRAIKELHPMLVFVDIVGIGAGVADRLRQIGHMNIIDVNFGEQATENSLYFNKRAECWVKTKKWLESGGQIPDDRELRDDLTNPEYGYDNRERIQLEKKKDMKARGLASPDAADALAVTFAEDPGLTRYSEKDLIPPEYYE